MAQQSEVLSYTIPILAQSAFQQVLPEQVPPLPVGVAPWPEYSSVPRTEVRLWQSEAGLHVGFQVWETNPRMIWRQHNEPVYKDSCVEFFLQPCPGSDARYVNFEMNAAGTLLLQIGSGRSDRQFLDPAGFTRFAIQSAGASLPDSPAEPCWQVAYTIPFEWLASLFPDFHPLSGWEMRGNFYKCGDETSAPHYGCWSPVTSAQPDFHRSCDFGLLVLA
ncbi:carbohydrate-binding family 9-like protein [Paenibacillus mesotrionivorans]|uniref:Carbohydrate-binding family 9-like protein n=1 Tax=Paenibacillus mesotrionivorans TaxID=3160968 RepID=A0ACC7P6Y2_9BACL